MNSMQVRKLRDWIPSGTRIILIHMDDVRAIPDNTVCTVDHVDDMGGIWTKEHGISIIADEDMWGRINRMGFVEVYRG